jgi:hypothetical protein
MNLDYVKKMRDRTPFRPFQIHLTSGEVLPVDHPESMSVPADENDLFVVWTSQSWNLLEAGQVARVSFNAGVRNDVPAWPLMDVRNMDSIGRHLPSA